MKSNLRHIAGLLVSVGFASLCFGDSPRTTILELFPNYNTIGVNVTLAVGDAQKDAWASLEYGPAKDQLRRGFRLSRVDNEFQRLSGSIFWCESGATYHVRVMLHDKTTPELNDVSCYLEPEGANARQETQIRGCPKMYYELFSNAAIAGSKLISTLATAQTDETEELK